ncbi:EAL domain-containing protein [Niveibacterium umoris]|uniref:EAL domain-containing protein (Putative c-di-GMP-specific phosphodiesterase class I)/AmiR/NasT family two-component response regulator n=1 Tax=Niveibacterium umoris TaxID=1193620 RepID=A0A840BVH4_9RHOO|nr:EAL domain-containing response regulator [Niveibacterium umoris]MBB4014317.1 EAL domain-containing protein (putative c-di-GMP-specific phosphodiesterase class I)/AmiR/NasT family two-component response regulator [Niveibacterium umoris]
MDDKQALRIDSVLVVDDSAVQRQHAVTLAKGLGIELVYEAGNGVEALELLALLTVPPALLVIDLEMPGMDGVELIQQLRERDIQIPIMVASSRDLTLIDSVEAMTAALGLEIVAALQKPLAAEQLADALKRIGRGGKAVAEGSAAIFVPLGESELAEAIRGGQIVPYFQPKVDVRTAMIKGVEALARWRHPERGMIAPDTFIPLAEKSGLIRELTMKMTERALAQAAQWNARELRLTMAINLSPLSLDTPGFPQEVWALQEASGVPADQIVWEITESSVVANLGAALGTLARLRLKGFGLSIDDYGTGFSSMQQLARIPFTELKIDRSFVHGASRKPHLKVILQSALDMSNRLGLVSVAEGVETMEDWRLLQESGCSVAQGFLIAKPMPGDELAGWLKGHLGRVRELRQDKGAH